MNNLEVFKNEEFGNVEVILFKEVELFRAKDVGDCLDINGSTLSEHLKNLDEDEVITLRNSDFGNTEHRKLNNAGEKFITESGIYYLVGRSRKPRAKEFSKWVRKIVLPTIRKTGGFVQEEKEEQFINNMFPALDEETKKVLLRDLIKKNKELKTKADYHDKVLNPTEEGAKFSKLITVTDVAKDLGLTARGLNKLMKENKILFKKSNVWKPYKEYENIIPELMDYHITEYGQSLKFTEKGRKWVIENLEQWKENLEI